MAITPFIITEIMTNSKTEYAYRQRDKAKKSKTWKILRKIRP